MHVDMGEAIEQLDSELAVNSQELKRIQHYKVINSPQHVMHMCVMFLLDRMWYC